MDDVKVATKGTLTDSLTRLSSSIAESQLILEGDKLLKETKRILRELSPRGTASGQLENSLGVSKVSINNEGLQVVRVGSPLAYAAIVERGRQPGQRPPPTEVIKKWLMSKQIPVPAGLTIDSYAFLIARKIGRKGTLALAFMQKAAANYRSVIAK